MWSSHSKNQFQPAIASANPTNYLACDQNILPAFDPIRVVAAKPCAMFFLKEETKVITLHPSYFGPNVREYLINRLNEEEEGRCTGDHFVICVMDMVDIGEGRVLPSGGQAEYTIKYRAIIWKPFRGETV